jgi:hypothetical protein
MKKKEEERLGRERNSERGEYVFFCRMKRMKRGKIDREDEAFDNSDSMQSEWY